MLTTFHTYFTPWGGNEIEKSKIINKSSKYFVNVRDPRSFRNDVKCYLELAGSIEMAANDLELQLLCFSLSTFPINMFQVETLTPHTFGGPWDPFNDKGCKLSYRMVPLKASGMVWKLSCDRLICFILFVLVLTSCQLQTLITNPSWLPTDSGPLQWKRM